MFKYILLLALFYDVKMNKKLPINCPSCESELNVHSLECPNCATSISGTFALPLFLKLDPKEQDLILEFVLSSGSLKEMAQKLKLSYPTVRNMLDELIQKITNLQSLNHE